MAVWFIGRMIRLPPSADKAPGLERKPDPIGDGLPGQAFSKHLDHSSPMQRSRQRIEPFRLRSIGECADIRRSAESLRKGPTVLSWTRPWVIVAVTVG
ncbi:MAG: hypothetical protein CV088_03230 [Nitrospira sp. LK70]|nr:hypothetical protein [Nitrospira sp. LK70]